MRGVAFTVTGLFCLMAALSDAVDSGRIVLF